MLTLSIIIPAKNEAPNLRILLPALTRLFPKVELIIVDDGSVDETVSICKQHKAIVVTHPYSMGNGAAVKSGARRSTGNILVFMDADGQHSPEDIQTILLKLEEGYDMVVGARRLGTQAGIRRALGNRLYNYFASWMTGFKIEDLTSGFRAVRAEKFKKFLYLLPNGFSYPTTITMAFFRSAYAVAYVPISAGTRQGKSKINLLKDGVRFFLIILKIGALFSPMRLFLPVSLVLFLTGLMYYSYTFISYGRFTNMSALLFISSLLTFLIGIVSEQVSSLHYRGTDDSSGPKN